jgi:hypothetical protein
VNKTATDQIHDGFMNEPSGTTVGAAIRRLWRNPKLLLQQWNWKAAGVGAFIRALIYLFANLKGGWRAGFLAMCVEAAYRVPLSGICGAFTQNFRRAQPTWLATLVVMVCLPLVTHSLELLIHWLQGAPRLRTSIIASVSFTILAALFNLYAMRRGVLVTGEEGGSIGSDFRRIPSLIAGFIAAGPQLLYAALRRLSVPSRAAD